MLFSVYKKHANKSHLQPVALVKLHAERPLMTKNHEKVLKKILSPTKYKRQRYEIDARGL